MKKRIIVSACLLIGNAAFGMEEKEEKVTFHQLALYKKANLAADNARNTLIAAMQKDSQCSPEERTEFHSAFQDALNTLEQLIKEYPQLPAFEGGMKGCDQITKQ